MNGVRYVLNLDARRGRYFNNNRVCVAGKSENQGFFPDSPRIRDFPSISIPILSESGICSTSGATTYSFLSFSPVFFALLPFSPFFLLFCSLNSTLNRKFTVG